MYVEALARSAIFGVRLLHRNLLVHNKMHSYGVNKPQYGSDTKFSGMESI